MGFAIPVDTVKRSLEQLQEDGEVSYAFLGVTSQELYPQLADHLEIEAETACWWSTSSPVVPPTTPASSPGTGHEFQGQRRIPEGGDTIVAVDGQEPRSRQHARGPGSRRRSPEGR